MTVESLAAEHQPLLRELEELRTLAKMVLEAHRVEDSRRLHELSALVADLVEDLALHLHDERKAQFARLRTLAEDHAQVRLLLADLRRLTHGYTPPPGACETWRELGARLAAFEVRLLAQMDLEEEFSAT